jgi:hypothetical protein
VSTDWTKIAHDAQAEQWFAAVRTLAEATAIVYHLLIERGLPAEVAAQVAVIVAQAIARPTRGEER